MRLVGADASVKSEVRKGDAGIDAAMLGPQTGKAMLVATGRHAGIKCTVLEVDADSREGARSPPHVMGRVVLPMRICHATCSASLRDPAYRIALARS